MASAFSHIAIPIALNIALGHQSISPKLLILGMFLAIAPDLDAIAFLFEIPYSSQWGHRGFTHSVFFALGISLILLPTAKYFKAKHITFFFITFISLTSHPLLDALTNGGLGVAFWWPFCF